MKAVVLVGGEGTRLRPLTLTTPKQMLPVGGRPMIERVLEQLAAHGIDEAVLSLGYRPDAFIEAYPDGRCAGVPLRYAVEAEPLDTAGAIRFAACDAGIDETFVVVNGDVLTDLDVGRAGRASTAAQGAEATIALTPVEDPSRFGVVPTDSRRPGRGLRREAAPGEAPTNLINAGTYVLEPSVLDRIPGGRRVSIERETFPAMVAQGTALRPGVGRRLARRRHAGHLPRGQPGPSAPGTAAPIRRAARSIGAAWSSAQRARCRRGRRRRRGGRELGAHATGVRRSATGAEVARFDRRPGATDRGRGRVGGADACSVIGAEVEVAAGATLDRRPGCRSAP